MERSAKPPKKQKQGVWRLINVRWILTITFVSLILSTVMSYLSNEALSNASNRVAFFILWMFIAFGIVFDMIGVAATASTEKEFHSMAARKVKGAKEAVWLIRNAEKVSSFCNDVIGDISGIISGATGAILVANLTSSMTELQTVLVSLGITGMIAALTIGGKAAGKAVGIGGSRTILFFVGKILSILPFSFDKRK